MQNLQICCCITLKESYHPDNDEAAPKDGSPNTSLPTRNICTLSVVVFRTSVPLFRCHSDGAHCRSEKVKVNDTLID